MNPWTTVMPVIKRAALEYVRRYHRHEVQVDATVPDAPVLVVANHGFGGIFDLNVTATYAALDRAGVRRPITALVHQVAWTLGAGDLVEAAGGRRASACAARDAFADGRHVLVFPGGDLDAGKSWWRRDQVEFGGRTGFAKLAVEAGVPIVPVVTAGAGESLFVLSDGRDIARALGLKQRLRLSALPVSLSLPWGLNVGMVGMLPYAPLPTKLTTAVLPAMHPEDGEPAEDFAARVHAAMQTRLDQLTADRTPIVG